MPLLTYGDATALRAASSDPYVAFEVDPEARDLSGYARDGALAWATRSPYRGLRWLYALGDPAPAAALAADVQECLAEPPYGVTVPAAALPLLPEELRPLRSDQWDWWWLDASPPEQPGEDQAGWLTDEAGLVEFLSQASPDRSADPGDDRVIRWAAIRRGERIVAAAAETQHVNGVPHLASIAVAPDVRGEGLGGAVTAWITRRILAEGAAVVTLGMYAHNEPARRVYRRLGFRDEHHLASGRTPYGDVRSAQRPR